MNFDIFTLPFSIGLVFIISYFIAMCVLWISNFSSADKIKLRKGIFSFKSFVSVKEVVLESLLHRKIFRVNPLLGYMHMSLAFGWFLLIVMGNLEARAYNPILIHPPYYPIFFRFFEPDTGAFSHSVFYEFIMDFLLLFVLSGVCLAYFKRFRSKALGMKRTSKLKTWDKWALTSLWMIFPLRLLAESFTSGIYENGGFLTGNLGKIFADFLPLQYLAYPAWWAYSIALGTFFISLPFSRYMHIPTELVLIFFRNYGIRSSVKLNGFADIEVKSCSRCGICIDACQMATSLNRTENQSVYFLRSLRERSTSKSMADQCMECGRCTEVCPVGIDLNTQRYLARKKVYEELRTDFSYLPDIRAKKADVIFFAGCMGHLTPSVIHAMKMLMDHAGIRYWFMDEDGGICCGRPLKLAGKSEEAKILMEKNRSAILNSGASILVTSCPICLKTFTEDYQLSRLRLYHHSQYLLQLWFEGRIQLEKQMQKAVYHDPCELGRGLGIYDEPRELLQRMMILKEPANTREKALCCGGSLAHQELTSAERQKIAADAGLELTVSNPDYLVTACPMCKKTFQQASSANVKDIAELVYAAIQNKKKQSSHMSKQKVEAAAIF
jgi:Fe-S oxidoreductase